MPRLIKLKGKRKNQAMTLIEVVFALTLLVSISCYSYWAMLKANEIADISRVYTAAQRLAKNQIDQILGNTPFVINPQTTSRVPAELTLGTTTQAVTITTEPQLNIQNNNATSYQVVTGTLKTVVTNISNTTTATQPQYFYQAVVTVTYTYRQRSYTVLMSTIRGSDL
jgi:type VI protein secretion system component VasF